MPDLQDDIARRIHGLERAVAELQARLAELESQAGIEPRRVPASPDDRSAPPASGTSDWTDGDAEAPAAAGWEPVGIDTSAIGAASTAGALALIGRTSVVLGGAFLLRALTESGRVPVVVGVSIGFAYALVWLAAAYRAGPGRRASAFFHGLASLLIALPLLLEAVARFHAYGPWTTAALLLFVTAFGLAAATRQQSRVLGALVAIGALLDTSAVAIATAEVVPFALLATALALVIAALAEPRGTSWLRWPTALVANLFLVALVGRAVGTPLAPPGQVLLVAGAFSAAYAWLIASGLLRHGRPLGVFEVLQTAFLVVVGLVGTDVVAGQIGQGVGLLVSVLTLLAGAACYAVGLGLSSDRPERLPTVHFFTSAAVAIVLVGATALMSGAVLSLWFVGSAVVFSWIGGRRLQPTFLMHGAVYSVAAAATSGLFATMARAWLFPVEAWPGFDPLLALAGGAAAIGVLGPRLPAGDFGGRLTLAARTTSAAVLVMIAATWVLLVVGPWLSATPDAGALAAMRSAALAGTAAAAAWAGLVHRARAAGRLAYPALAAGAAKLLIEDFWRSGPMMLFVALACFGLALIVTARLRSRA